MSEEGIQRVGEERAAAALRETKSYESSYKCESSINVRAE